MQQPLPPQSRPPQPRPAQAGPLEARPPAATGFARVLAPPPAKAAQVDEERPRGWGNSTARWLRFSVMTGIAISMVVHLFLLSAAALVVLASTASNDSPGGAPVQFAVLNESELAEIAGGSLETSTPEVPDAPSGDLPEIDITIPETVGLESLRETLAETGGGGTGAGDIGTGGDGLGGTGGGAGGGTGAGFFGVEASGNRFAYIVDVSGSMAIGGKMDAMRSELLRSINGLLDNHSFMVVPFSSDAAPLGGRTGWMDATEQGKSWTRRAAMGLKPEGGTNPSPGFFYVFSQRPKPDAIYFLTDGEFGDSVPAEVAGLNGEWDVPIHCIAFGTRDSEPNMKRIADQSGGTYTFVPLGGIP